MSNELISVVMGAFNHEKYVAEAIESVLAQSWDNIELIVIDDGSTDETKAIITSVADERIRFFAQSNQGISATRNRGIALAKGNYIAFIDSDDCWHKEKLARQFDALNHAKSIGMVSCGRLVVGGSGEFVDTIMPPDFKSRKEVIEDLLIRNQIGGVSSVLIKKECFDTVGGFDVDLNGTEDRDMWLRIAQKYDVTFVYAPLIRYRVHAHNYSNRATTMKNVQMKFYKKHLLKGNILMRCKALSAIHLSAAMEQDVDNGCQITANALTAIMYYPFKIHKTDIKYRLFFYGIYCIIKDLFKREWHYP